MDFKSKIIRRIGMNDIHEICFIAQGNNARKQELYDLLFDENEDVAYNAAWIFTHFDLYENRWLYDRQDEMIDEAITCSDSSKRRLLLALIYRQPLAHPPRVDFLNFCMERMVSKSELPGVQSLCMKMAYELCRRIPELLQEYCVMLEMLEQDLLPPSLRAVHRNVLKAMKKGKSLQQY